MLGVTLLAAALLVAGAALIAIRVRPLSRVLLLSGAALVLIAGAAAGYAWQRHYLRGRYQFNPGVSYLARAWAFFRTVHDARVGVVGTFGGFFAYPLYRPRRAPTASSTSARAAAARLVHARSLPVPAMAIRRSTRAAIATWSRPRHATLGTRTSAPSVPRGRLDGIGSDAQLVLSRRASGQPIDVYEIRGGLDPAACGRARG